MTQAFIYLLFDGTCADAMRFYEGVFRGHVEVLQTVGESPMASQFPASNAHRVIHARVSFAGNTIMASDWMAPEPYPGIRGLRVMIVAPGVEIASRTFAALGEGGKIETPLAPTPFAQAYGTLTDRYGVPWQVMAQ